MLHKACALPHHFQSRDTKRGDDYESDDDKEDEHCDYLTTE